MRTRSLFKVTISVCCDYAQKLIAHPASKLGGDEPRAGLRLPRAHEGMEVEATDGVAVVVLMPSFDKSGLIGVSVIR